MSPRTAAEAFKIIFVSRTTTAADLKDIKAFQKVGYVQNLPQILIPIDLMELLCQIYIDL